MRGQSHAKLPPKTPGTIGLYDFTMDTGQFAIDRSGHDNHGIIIGAKYAKAESD